MAIANQTLTARLSGPLRGSVTIPCAALDGQLAVVLAAVSVGRSQLSGIGERADILATMAALRVLGCRIASGGDGVWAIDGVGIGGLGEPDHILEVGEAGLGVPFLIALTAMQPMTTILNGGDAFRDRSWHWLTSSLEQSGAGFVGRAGTMLPLTVLGSTNPLPQEFAARSAVERATLLVAALNCPGETTVSHEFSAEERPDRIFAAFGARLASERRPDGDYQSSVVGQGELWPATLALPGDPAVGLLIATAALSRPDSEVVLGRLTVDERLVQALAWFRSLGAEIATEAVTTKDEALLVDLRVRSSALRGAVISPDDPAVAIDDYPLLAVLAARAAGRTVLEGWERRPEWLAPLASGLRGCGVDARVEGTTLVITGNGGQVVAGGCRIEAALDHRVAAAFLILGLTTAAPVVLDHGAELLEHYPSLLGLLTRLGGVPTVIDP